MRGMPKRALRALLLALPAACMLVLLLSAHHHAYLLRIRRQLRESTAAADRPLPDWIDPPTTGPHNVATKPEWCLALRHRPRERSREQGDCGRGRFDAVCSDGAPRFFSQYNQDCYLYLAHFRHLRRAGYYVDIGATEPVRYSNTWFYDKCLGWAGVCVEANAKYHAHLRARRSCALVRRCVSSARANRTFIDADGLSGVLETNANRAAWARRNQSAREERRFDARCVRTADALAPLGMTHVDLLSLDVEGHELDVLRGIDWKRVRINVIVLDHATEEIGELLWSLGYKQRPVARRRWGKVAAGDMWTDLVFVHGSVTWGRPE